jgi:hypothetical protein
MRNVSTGDVHFWAKPLGTSCKSVHAKKLLIRHGGAKAYHERHNTSRSRERKSQEQEFVGSRTDMGSYRTRWLLAPEVARNAYRQRGRGLRPRGSLQRMDQWEKPNIAGSNAYAGNSRSYCSTGENPPKTPISKCLDVIERWRGRRGSNPRPPT